MTTMTIMTTTKLRCAKCGYEWVMRDPKKPPLRCPHPKCQSPNWEAKIENKKTK